MISADEYYSKQMLEPPGSRASWNARDQHMMTTIMRLRANSEELFGRDHDVGTTSGIFERSPAIRKFCWQFGG